MSNADEPIKGSSRSSLQEAFAAAAAVAVERHGERVANTELDVEIKVVVGSNPPISEYRVYIRL